MKSKAYYVVEVKLSNGEWIMRSGFVSMRTIEEARAEVAKLKDADSRDRRTGREYRIVKITKEVVK